MKVGEIWRAKNIVNNLELPPKFRIYRIESFYIAFIVLEYYNEFWDEGGFGFIHRTDLIKFYEKIYGEES